MKMKTLAIMAALAAVVAATLAVVPVLASPSGDNRSMMSDAYMMDQYMHENWDDMESAMEPYATQDGRYDMDRMMTDVERGAIDAPCYGDVGAEPVADETLRSSFGGMMGGLSS